VQYHAVVTSPAVPTIAVLGSINMDLVTRVARFPAPGETVLGGRFATFPGGKGANQAVAAARAGASVRMIGAVGDDAYAPALLETLRESGVNADAVAIRAAAHTGVGVISIAEGSGENSIIVASGANMTITTDEVHAARDAIAQADALLIQLEIPPEANLAAARIARDAGVMVVLNAAPAAPLSWEFLASIDVLVVNQTEAAQIAAQRFSVDESEFATADDAARLEHLARLGVATVVMTLGAEGAAVAHQRRARRVPPFAVTPIDTVGAGDAFAGVLAVRLAEHRIAGSLDPGAIDDAVTWACAAGALATTRPGAIPSMPTRAEIVKMLLTR
jgi:ribokinase